MNGQTFYYTNSAPQIQNAFNGGIWVRLETLEKEWGFRGIGARDTLYVVTGSTFEGGPLKVTSDDSGNTIPVPTHFYKAMLTTKGSGVGKSIGECSAAELKCVAVYLEHFGHANNAHPTSRNMMTIADLETVTGIEFFPMIAPDARSVKSSFDAGEWAGIR
jgi:endonuclease G